MNRIIPRAVDFAGELYLWLGSITLAETLAGHFEARPEGPLHFFALIAGMLIPFGIWSTQNRRSEM